ncbi:MAG: hypothetical protein QXG08_06745 [Candidatus Methanomethyliaceae archaeon]
MTFSKSDEELILEIQKILESRINQGETSRKLAEQVFKSARDGLEYDGISFEDWLEKRFKYQLVWLDSNDYARALTRALWLAPHFAGTDFGSSRQRDMGQEWTDTARGFMGEIAVGKFLKDKFNVETLPVTRRGAAEEFMETDIDDIVLPNGQKGKSKIKVSVKTGKFNSRWLDVGTQYTYSDVYMFVKVGVLRTHFLSFLKDISFLKDKLFPRAVALKELGEEESRTLWDEVPTLQPLPAYIAGYINKPNPNSPITSLKWRVRKGRKSQSIVITQGVGIMNAETIRSFGAIKQYDPEGNLPIEIEPIIKQLEQRDTHFLASCGGLLWGNKNMTSLMERIVGQTA